MRNIFWTHFSNIDRGARGTDLKLISSVIFQFCTYFIFYIDVQVFGSPHGVSYYTGENEGPRHSELGKLLTHSEVSESDFSATSAGQ